jgi:hypothetical protein
MVGIRVASATRAMRDRRQAHAVAPLAFLNASLHVVQ